MEKLLNCFVQNRLIACRDCVCNADFENPCSQCFLGKWGPKNCNGGFIEPKLRDHEKNTDFPTLGTMVKSFIKSSTQEIKAAYNKTPRLTKTEANNRMEICKTCTFFDKQSSRCKKCGCFMPIKTAWRSQKCPIGKW